MKFKIITLGCKVNMYESEYILESLKEEGFIYDENNPDLIIINTCSVTNTADSKSLKIIRKTKREYPSSILVVCGCSSQNNQSKYEELGIDILIGNKNKSEIKNIIKDYCLTKKKYSYFTKELDLDFEDMKVAKFTTHTRAFIKIQDGCNNFCSFCIIPYTRGNVRSKDYKTTIEEIKQLVANNHKEIVLTGIHTGSYFNNEHDLSDLIEEIAKIENLERIRISSIEITELNSKFLKILKATPKICDHLHIPLQSGSDAVLKRMNRKYDKDYYRQKIADIRAICPDISITTDCLVGHPYETEEDFFECLNFCQEIAFSKIHVFPYSLREGTTASFMPQVKAEIKKKRAKRLIELSQKLEEQYLAKFINQELEVLTEEYQGEYIVGHTSNYLKVLIKGDYALNKLYKVRIKEQINNEAYGEVITCLNSKLSL